MTSMEIRDLGSRIAWVILGLLVAAIAIRYGTLQKGLQLLEKYPPDFSAPGWLRLAGSTLAAFLIYLALKPARGQTRSFLDGTPSSHLPAALSITAAAIVLATMAAVIFIPDRLYPWVTDAAAVQTISELFLAGTIGFAVYAAVRSRQVEGAKIGVLPAPLPFAAMAVVSLLILGEEMSWGQHLIGWETPEKFAGNIQNETNLHNFYTYRFETAYYLAALVLFFVLPYAWVRRPGRLLSMIAFFVPPAGFMLIAVPISGLFYEYWNVVPMQIAFALGVILLLDAAFDKARGTPAQRVWAGTWALLMLASQAVFLLYGSRMTEGHELSEIREFLISFLMFVYLGWLLWRIRQARVAAGPART
ncbi:hypothetical protein FQ775_19545 [Nitratireductor mangrovi]|uniref:Uncharacterized protein n=1 Tax=Nitratireductor mangrovi TaxID=2599600 RepID=A0A5B8L493_9HYPH|nr:hypothetical protein [Nitratireductor mangrovi]QDZ02388.1 hypothetical protein FQ775_19545 [Nitratireductor mangrovi]